MQETEAVQRRGIPPLECERGLFCLERLGAIACRASRNGQIVEEARVPDPRHRLAIDRDGLRRTSGVLQRAAVSRLKYRSVGKSRSERFQRRQGLRGATRVVVCDSAVSNTAHASMTRAGFGARGSLAASADAPLT